MKSVLQYKRTLTVLGATFTAVSGACWGYVFASNEMEKSFEDRVDKAIFAEVDKTRRFYATRYKDFGPEEVSELGPEHFEKPDEPIVVSERQVVIPDELLSTPEGREQVRQALEDITSQPETVLVNAFDPDLVPMFDENELINARSSDHPYVISKDEFIRNDAHYEEFKLTFFEGDGVLVGEDDEFIPDTQQVVGDDNLQRFGVMSNDNNVVYVQNDMSEAMFMVTRSQMSAQAALYGPDADEEAILEHSSMKPRRRSRDEH